MKALLHLLAITTHGLVFDCCYAQIDALSISGSSGLAVGGGVFSLSHSFTTPTIHA